MQVQPREAAEAMAAQVLELLSSWTVLLTNTGASGRAAA